MQLQDLAEEDVKAAFALSLKMINIALIKREMLIDLTARDTQ